MKWFDQLRFRLRPFLGRRRVHDEIDDELRFHIEMETRKYVAQGASPEEAHRRAMVRFGGVERFKEEVRGVDGVSLLEKVWNDLRYGMRGLVRNPVFSAVGVLTLALGIGASTAIFSVVDGILLRSLPFPESDRLVTLWADVSRRGGPVREWLNYPDFHDAERLDHVFEAAALWGGWGPTLVGRGDATMLDGYQVSQRMFGDVLGVAPELGRGFRPEDDQPGAPGVVVLSYGFWASRFGADPAILGQTLTLDAQPYTIIGVMPPGFRMPYGEDAQLWGALQWNETSQAGTRGHAHIRSIARLREGMTVEAARVELDRLGARLEVTYPESNTGVGYALFPLQEDLVSVASSALWVLLGAVGFVLLLVCVNLANLLLARGSARTGELAVRSALGASGGRIAGQLLTESVLLAVIGGALGLGVAFLGTDLLVAIAPEGTPRIHEVTVDGRILAFAALATLASAVLFGLLPSLQGSRTDLRSGLSEGGRGGDGRRRGRSIRSWLVAGQVALAIVMLVGAGLFLRTLGEMSRADLGFDPRGVATFALFLPPTRYPDVETRVGYHREVEARLSTLPGVTAVGAVNSLPLRGQDGDASFTIEGRPVPAPGEETVAWIRRVTPGYFDAMGLRLRSGRGFGAGDDREAPRVVMVNETLARRYFGDQDPVGQRLNFSDPDDPTWREIVGVVGNIRNFGIRDEGRNSVYFPYAQVPSTFMTVVVKSTGDAASVVPMVRREIGVIDPQIALDVQAMEEVVRGSMEAERFVASLLSIFAAVALILAAVGLYGVVSYGVSRRLREMGVRVALGARAGQIGRLVVGRSVLLAVAGVVVGLGGALGLSRLVEGLLFGVSPADPGTFATVAVIMVVVAVAASALPAWRAARVDPVRVLKAE